MQQGKTMDILFSYLKALTSLTIFGGPGGGGFNNQTGPILVHIHPLICINVHAKYVQTRPILLSSYPLTHIYVHVR